MVPWYFLIIVFIVGAGVAWGYRGWIARTKEKIQRKL